METYFKQFNIRKPVYLLLLLFFGFISYSQEKPKTENSVSIDLKNEDIKWGACPDFIPEGCKVTVLHGDPSVGNADALFKFDPNTDLPEHWHNSAERMILVQGELEVTYEGEDTQTLKAGHYAYGPAMKPHKARCNDEGPCLLFVAFEKPVDAFPGKAK